MQAPQFRNGAAALSLYPPFYFVGLFVKNFSYYISKGRVSRSKSYAFTRQNLSFCPPKHDLLQSKTSSFDRIFCLQIGYNAT